MHILFLTLARIKDISESGIYTDLLREFKGEGHDVSIVCPTERRYKEKTVITDNNGVTILNVRTPNIQKTSLLEKGIAILLIEYLFLRAIKKYLGDAKVNLVLFSTPPITFVSLVNYIKKIHGAVSYLLLKDIFPQNAVDLGMIKQNGMFHKYFRKREKELYRMSDFIGCMSPANVRYLLNANNEIDAAKVEICPNSVTPAHVFLSDSARINIRKKYNIPERATVFIYGGNLGIPQGIDFLIEVLASQKENELVYFVIVGNGTEYGKVEKWFKINVPVNAMLQKTLDKKVYNQLLESCDVGLIFLDPRFTIPNFPSRLLSYMEYKLPVIAATDRNTDVGAIAENEGFGFSLVSGDLPAFNRCISILVENEGLRRKMGAQGRRILDENYTAEHSCQIILRHFDENV